jgi:hypothetical protein
MVLHIVLFRPKAGISEADRASMFAALDAAARDIPVIRRFQVGGRITHGAEYEKLMRDDFPFAAVIEFSDAGGLQAYLHHPAHERLAQLFYRLQESALVYDYDTRPA